MGNCHACLSRKSVHHSEEHEEGEGGEEMVRVVRTTDNELFEFPGPVSVKDLLFGFQGFAVFPPKSPASSSLFKQQQQQQPLPPDTLLKFSHLYYLRPLVHPSFIINPLTHHEVTQPSFNWVKPALIKPLINIGTLSLVNQGDKDLLLGQQALAMGSAAKPSITGTAEDLITFNHPDKASSEHAERPVAMNPLQGSQLSEHAEGLISISAPVAAPPEGSLALNAHDRALNELAEGLLTPNAHEKTPSSGVPTIDHSPSQTMKVRKVRFSDEVMVIPSLSEHADPLTPICSLASTSDTIASTYESEQRFGEAVGDYGDGIGYYSASREVVLPHRSKKEMNGVVRLKVVLSKKQLTELMGSRASGDKQSGAVMERMLAPLLSPTNSSCRSDKSFHGGSSCASPSWRPSLHHIPEDHSSQELF